eukprot:m.11868 g.11868  ORF g.11868 m.11868 type:complete len:128 (-) comp16593_c0_seq1:572-955(-)
MLVQFGRVQLDGGRVAAGQRIAELVQRCLDSQQGLFEFGAERSRRNGGCHGIQCLLARALSNSCAFATNLSAMALALTVNLPSLMALAMRSTLAASKLPSSDPALAASLAALLEMATWALAAGAAAG